MFRKLPKFLLANLIYTLKFDKDARPKMAEPDPKGTCSILMYHRVLPTGGSDLKENRWLRIKSHPGIVMSPETFGAQMRFLRDYYNIITLVELANRLKSGVVPHRSAVVTFDDGWRDNFEFALPVLKEYNIPATIFLSAGYIGTKRTFWPEKVIHCLAYEKSKVSVNLKSAGYQIQSNMLRSLENALANSKDEKSPIIHSLIETMKAMPPMDRSRVINSITSGIEFGNDCRVMMNWDELREMAKHGIQFGSHGMEHEILTHLDDAEIRNEIKLSKEIIAEKIGVSPSTFAYPNGNCDDNIKRMVAECGYLCAVSTKAGIVRCQGDLFALKRINVHQDNGTGLSGRFSGKLFSYHIDLRF